jgi:hypothetical protein
MHSPYEDMHVFFGSVGVCAVVCVRTTVPINPVDVAKFANFTYQQVDSYLWDEYV